VWIPPAYSPVGFLSPGRGLAAGETTVRQLESRLVQWYGAEKAVATGSGTQGLQLALQVALHRQQAGKHGVVAMPAFNCYDLVSAAVWAGGKVVFYDVDPLTLSPVPESLAHVAQRADVLLVANLYGFPLDWDLIRSVADSRGLPVVEDAAQGLGAAWGGKAAGTLGDLTVLSFGRGKGWTGGSGGAVLGRRGLGADLPETFPPDSNTRFVDSLKAAAIWILARPVLYGIPARLSGLGLGDTHYRLPAEPRAISPFAAALVQDGRARSLVEVEHRRRNAETLRSCLGGIRADMQLPRPLPGGVSGDLRVPILVPEGDAAEARRWGLYRGYPGVLPDLDAVAPLMIEDPRVPGAARLASQLLTAPVHSRSAPRQTYPKIASWLSRVH